MCIGNFFSRKSTSQPLTSVSVTVTTEFTSRKIGTGDCPIPKHMAPIEPPVKIDNLPIGYYNLATFTVSGHIVNPSTGRNNKKVLTVNAIDENDAEAYAASCGILPPFVTKFIPPFHDEPNEYQIAGAKEYGVILPNDVTNTDARAMVERAEDNWKSPTLQFAQFCTDRRILFSRYIGENNLIQLAIYKLSKRDNIALFAHAVFCAISGVPLGNPLDTPFCFDFADSAPDVVKKQIQQRLKSDLPRPRRGTNAWKAVEQYIFSHSIEIPSHPSDSAPKDSNHEDDNCGNCIEHIGQRKNKWVSVFLCLFLGGIGVHKFYEGKNGIGILYLFTVGLFGIGWLVDFILLLLKPNPYYV